MMIGLSATAGQGAVSWKSTGRSLSDAPSPRAASQTFRQVPSKARICGNRFVTGETATMPSVTTVPRAKAETGAASGRKAQALLIYSDTKGARHTDGIGRRSCHSETLQRRRLSSTDARQSLLRHSDTAQSLFHKPAHLRHRFKKLQALMDSQRPDLGRERR